MTSLRSGMLGVGAQWDNAMLFLGGPYGREQGQEQCEGLITGCEDALLELLTSKLGRRAEEGWRGSGLRPPGRQGGHVG